jgi:Fe-S oxidoreductase
MSQKRSLTMLEERTAALEMCGYCPKLCRGACPVSEAEASEALIPWGKMSMTWYAARGDIEPAPDVAALPWACTGCYACRDRCEHQNPVAETLRAARSVYQGLGLAPARSEAALAGFHARRERLAGRARELDGAERGDAALLIGCGYLSLRSAEAKDVVLAARRLLGSVSVLTGCCGLAQREAGDGRAADELRDKLLDEAGGRPLLAADAGCALELRSAGAKTLAELGAGALSRLERVPSLGDRVRWHDPCRLSRGLGIQAEPRSILERALGAPPAEFVHSGREGQCSGAGGLLPLTMPRTAQTIARARLSEHSELGGGVIATACAASLRWLRLAGANVIDLSTVLARSLSRG